MRKFVGSSNCCSCSTLFCTNSCECSGIEGPDGSQGRNVLQDKILVGNIVLPTGIEIAYRTSGEITCYGTDDQEYDDYISYSSENISQFGYKSIPSTVMERIDYDSTETFNSSVSGWVGRCCYRSDDVNVPVGDTLADGWFMGPSLDLSNSDGGYPTTQFELLADSGWPSQPNWPTGYYYLDEYARYMGVRGIEFSVRNYIDYSSSYPYQTYTAGVLSILPKELWIPRVTDAFLEETFQIRSNEFFLGNDCGSLGNPLQDNINAYWDGTSIHKISWDDPECSQGTYGPSMVLYIPLVDVPVDPDATRGPIEQFPWPHMGMSPSFFAQDSKSHAPSVFTPCTDGIEDDECVTASTASQIKVGADVDLSLSKICWNEEAVLGTNEMGCWSNNRGGGCVPVAKIGMPANSQPTQNLSFTEPDGTVWTQNGDSYWSSNGVNVPVASSGSDPQYQEYVRQRYGTSSHHSSAGKKLSVSVFRPTYQDPNDPFAFPVFGFQRDYTVDLDKCGGGTITGLDDTNPSLITTFEWPYGEDCAECETPETQYGCCLLPDGTTQITNGASACEGTLNGVFQGVSTSCPPVGCCAISGSPDLNDVTEAHCTSQAGVWTEGGTCGPTGYCQDTATGTVTSGVEENDCTGTWSAEPFPTGCCEISGATDQSGKNQAECTALGGTWIEGESCGGLGFCVDDSTGAITPDVEEDECTGTWSATEPTSGCCTIGGNQNPDVAESWCTSQSGTFVSGDCPSTVFDSSTSSRIVVNSVTLDAPDPNMNCSDNFEMTVNIPATGSYTTSPTKSRSMSGKIEGGDYEYAYPTFGSSITNSSVEVVFDDTAGTYFVRMTINWAYNNNFGVVATTNPAPISGIGNCPSFTISGTFDSIVNGSGKTAWTQSCNSQTAADLVGSYNITVECQ